MGYLAINIPILLYFQAGSEFQTASYSPAHIATQFAIAVLYDDTEVTMKLADDNDLPAPYNTKGMTIRFVSIGRLYQKILIEYIY